MTQIPTQQDANDFLMQGGARAFKFGDVPGTAVRGRIVELAMQQQRDLGTKALKYWDDGNPMMQLRIILQTELSEDDNDDGKRAVYVKGQMQTAIREAIKATGASNIVEGGTLAIRFEGLGERTNPGFNPPKLYKAKYEAPVTSVSTDDF